MKRRFKPFRRAIFLIIVLVFFLNNSVLAVSQSDIVNVSALVIGEGIPGTKAPSFSFPDFTPPAISYLEIIRITSSSATIVWLTDEPAASQVEYGSDESYGEITLLNKSLGAAHSVVISNLTSDTLYHFRAVSKDAAGNKAVSSDYTFTTLPLPDTVAPANVSEIKAIPGNRQIKLSWKNPFESDFAGIKIQRATDFYPLGPNQGRTIYTGAGSFFQDAEVVNGVRYYYSFFSYDFAGNFSSGSIISAIPQTPEKIVPAPPLIPEKIPEIPGPILRPQEKLKIADVCFYTANRSLKLSLGEEERLKVLKNTSVLISIKKELVPLTLKTIIISVEPPLTVKEKGGRKILGSSSYLLKLDKEKDCYEAIFRAPGSEQIYPLSISVLDYYTGALDNLKTDLISESYGVIFKKQRNFQTEELEEVGIDNAQVALYQFNDKSHSWKLWQAKKFNQENPKITGSTGEFGFLVPEGKYRLKISADGYNQARTKNFQVKENVINPNIELKAPLRFSFASFVFLILILIGVIGIIWRTIINRGD